MYFNMVLYEAIKYLTLGAVGLALAAGLYLALLALYEKTVLKIEIKDTDGILNNAIYLSDFDNFKEKLVETVEKNIKAEPEELPFSRVRIYTKSGSKKILFKGEGARKIVAYKVAASKEQLREKIKEVAKEIKEKESKKYLATE